MTTTCALSHRLEAEHVPLTPLAYTLINGTLQFHISLVLIGFVKLQWVLQKSLQITLCLTF
jgi:hypothetical protein